MKENDHKPKFSVSLLNTDIKEELKNWLGEKTSSSRETLEETECKFFIVWSENNHIHAC